MKFLFFLVLFILTGCSQPLPDSLFEWNQGDISINLQENTISFEENLFYFSISNRRISIHFSDDSWWTRQYSISGEVYEESGRFEGSEEFKNELLDILSAIRQERTTPMQRYFPIVVDRLFPAIFIIILGGSAIGFPNFYWFLASGWLYKNVEPSALAIEFYRLLGIIVLVYGIAELL